MKNKDLNKQFNIPAWVRGNSPADEAKSIQNRFKDRKDKASRETMEELLKAVADKQEYVKMQESLANEATQVPDQMNGEIPQGMEQFANGGKMNNYAWGSFLSNDTQRPQMSTASTVTPTGPSFSPMTANTNQAPLNYTNGRGVSQGSNLGGQGLAVAGGIAAGLAGDPSESQYGDIDSIKGSNTLDKGKDAAGAVIPLAGLFRGLEKGTVATAQKTNGDEGAAISQAMFSPSDNIMKLSTDKDLTGAERAEGFFHTIFNPIGAGATIHKGNERRKHKAQGNAALKYNSQFDNNFALGGFSKRKPVSSLIEEEYIDGLSGLAPMREQGLRNREKASSSLSMENANLFQNPMGDMREKPMDIQRKDRPWGNEFTQPGFENTQLGKGLKTSADWMGQNYGNVMQYAPIIGNLTDKLEKAEDPRRNRMDNRYSPDYVDETQLQKIVQGEHGTLANSLRGASGGSGGRLSANLLGASLNKTKALSNAYLQADGINKQQNATAQQFNANTDRTNLQQSNLDIADAQANEGAYQTAKSAKRAALYEDIGKIGKEEVDKKLVKEMFGYTWDGKYFKDDKGTVIPSSEVFAKLKKKEEEDKAKSKTNQKMFGGYLKRK